MNTLVLDFAIGVWWIYVRLSLRYVPRTLVAQRAGFSRYSFAVVLSIFIAMQIQCDCALCYAFSMGSLIILQCPSVSLVIFCILKSNLSDMNIAFLNLAKKKIKLSLVTIMKKGYSHTPWWRYMIIKLFRWQFGSIYWKMYILAHWSSDFNYRNLSLKKNNHTRAKIYWMCKDADCSIVHNSEEVETT